MKKSVAIIAGIITIAGAVLFNTSEGFSLNLISELFEEEATANSSSTVIEYNGSYFEEINNNIPYFTEEDKNLNIFESYSELDNLGRAGIAFAKINQSLMPTEDRESIGGIKPTGWHTVKYEHVSGKYLYNRSHLIGFQLTGENANEENLITGTRSFNVEGMLPFENLVADYIKETNDPVLYRVTPVYEGNNLVASGVTIEAQSIIEDGILFNVYVHNVEPGVEINYLTGESKLID